MNSVTLAQKKKDLESMKEKLAELENMSAKDPSTIAQVVGPSKRQLEHQKRQASQCFLYQMFFSICVIHQFSHIFLTIWNAVAEAKREKFYSKIRFFEKKKLLRQQKKLRAALSKCLSGSKEEKQTRKVLFLQRHAYMHCCVVCCIRLFVRWCIR